MELSVLDSSFKRSRLVESYNSLVWTERHSKNGDFQLVSNDISDILSLLPLGAPDDPPLLVAIADSDVPMVVETHKIEKPKNGVSKITTSGRSFETVLDRRETVRHVISGTPRDPWTIAAPTAAVAAYEVAKEIIVDGIPSALDIIPEIDLLNSVLDSGVSQEYPVEPKELYTWMIETLALGKYGLKAEMSDVLTNQIAVIIYKGTDRREELAFDVALDQIEEAVYLLTELGYKNTMITATTNGQEYATLGSPVGGLARRVGFQDLSSEITAPAGVPLTNVTINKGKVALADLLPVALFQGGVADNISRGYNDTYFLGDIVKLQGEFGLSQDVRIAEFIRTEDTTGSKAYPTFEAIV